MTAFENRAPDLISRMRAICADPQFPLLAAGIGVLREGKVAFCETVGTKFPDGGSVDADTKYRIASISKLVTAIGIWQLIEAGQLDPDADVSGYLGFGLRNPAYPDTPITARMLLSHTSSIRDGGVPGSYNIPMGHPIRAFFTEVSPYYNPNCWAPAGEEPGVFFKYCNMNYCLLGTILERVSGTRFDRYMTNHVFRPMGLSCSYNVCDLPPAQVAPLYRRLGGVWTAQCDDFSKGGPTEGASGYVIGTNGSLYGPMGSLRISIRELCAVMELFCGGGTYRGVEILKPQTVERMFTPAWTYDPARKNGDSYGGLMRCYGMGPHIFTNQPMGDRLVRDQALPFSGHTAEAYGLVGGMAFDRKKASGIVYFAAGLGCDPTNCPGSYSALYAFEEALLTAAADFARFPYE